MNPTAVGPSVYFVARKHVKPEATYKSLHKNHLSCVNRSFSDSILALLLFTVITKETDSRELT